MFLVSSQWDGSYYRQLDEQRMSVVYVKGINRHVVIKVEESNSSLVVNLGVLLPALRS